MTTLNKRQFAALLKRITTKKMLNTHLIGLLTNVEREEMVLHIVRNRGPVVKELIPDLPGKYLGHENIRAWMFACGYTQETKGKLYTFVHTGEQRIK